MVRKSSLNIDYSNSGKLETLEFIMDEMSRVVNLYIDKLWSNSDFSSKFVNFQVNTWLSVRMQQCMGKQALEIVKSQRKRKKKTRPTFRGTSFTLDSRFFDFQFDDNTFDVWIRLKSIGNRYQLKLPSRKHVHYNTFKTWEQANTIQIVRKFNKHYVNVFFKKEVPKVKKSGSTIGADCGYKKLLITSDGNVYDDGLEEQYRKISRKKQGSKSFKRALAERDNLINRSLNKLDLNEVRELVVEKLRSVKKNTKGKFRKTFNNKLQRWSYPKVLGKLRRMTEGAGVQFTEVNPAYTSQKCCSCGVVCETNRNGETYKCTCGNEMDADLNAAINLSHMGVYSPHVLYCNC